MRWSQRYYQNQISKSNPSPFLFSALSPVLGTGIFAILTYSSKYLAGPSSLLSFLIAAVASCLGGKNRTSFLVELNNQTGALIQHYWLRIEQNWVKLSKIKQMFDVRSIKKSSLLIGTYWSSLDVRSSKLNRKSNLKFRTGTGTSNAFPYEIDAAWNDKRTNFDTLQWNALLISGRCQQAASAIHRPFSVN